MTSQVELPPTVFAAPAADGHPHGIPAEMLPVLFHHLPDTLISIDAEERITWLSANAFRLFGYGVEELIGGRVSALFARPDEWAACLGKFINGAGTQVKVQFEARRKDGSAVWAALYARALFGEDNRFLGAQGLVRDVSDHWQTRKTLEDSEDRFRRLSDVATEAICIHYEGKILDFNKAFENLFGYDREELVGMWAWQVIHPDDVPRAQDMVRQHYEQAYEVRGSRKDGSIFPMEIHSKQSWMGERSVRVTSIRDITERKRTEEMILHQALYDGLTDLPNRRHALERLSAAIEQARRERKKVALMFVDLDEFKQINDSLGHEYGDELLVMAAERLQAAVPEGSVVARFGGDEFLVIIGSCRAGVAEKTAEAIIGAFAQPFAISRRDLITTGSIGIALYPDDGHTPQTLLRNADTAMYQAKLAGRNRHCFFTARMSEEAESRLRMESELRRALGSDQLFLRYQPLVEIATGKVVAVEALLRWNNPELGAIPPDRFIPQAETSGLIVPIGRQVLMNACRTARQWVDAGHHDIRVCVNVSPRQFQDPHFLADVRTALADAGLPPRHLELEITEGLLLKERPEVDEVLRSLTHLGVSLAIDDFGTGYSSLSYLERYPFDTLKIDRSFLVDMFDRRERMVLVETIVAMSSGLGLKVVAEGVETAQQLAHLKAIGCDSAQGYLFSRPVAEDELAAILAKGYGPTEARGPASGAAAPAALVAAN